VVTSAFRCSGIRAYLQAQCSLESYSLPLVGGMGGFTGKSCPKHRSCIFATTGLGLIRDLMSLTTLLFASAKVLQGGGDSKNHKDSRASQSFSLRW